MRRLVGILVSVGLVHVAAAQPADAPPSEVAQPPEPPPPPSPPKESPPQPPIAVVVPKVVSEPPADKHAIHVSYDSGLKFETVDKAFALKIAFRNQFRFETARSTKANSQFLSHFLIPRSRLQAEGHAFGPNNRFKLEFSFEDSGGFAYAKDLYVEKKLAASPVWIRVGHWKRPFNRQELVADFASEFNERAVTAAFVGGGRDIGVAIHNDYEKSPEGLEWAAGVFNGFSGVSERPVVTTTCTQGMTAITCTTPTPTNFAADFGPTLVLHAGWNVGKIKGYSEGDLEGGPLRLAVGASYKIDLANFGSGSQPSVSDNLSHGLEADAMLKANGFGLELGLYMMKIKTADARYGVFVQPGYFVVPKHGELAARFAYAPIDIKGSAPGTRAQIEVRGAFNWYWQGQSWKWATDIGFVQLTGQDAMMVSDKPNLQLRTMLQLIL